MNNDDRIKSAIIQTWAAATAYTTYTIAAATEGIGATTPLPAENVSRHLHRWAKEGVAELQANRLRQGNTAWRFRWGPDGATLASVLELAFRDLSLAQNRRLRTALRRYLEVERKDDDSLLDAARTVPADALYGLPDRVEEAGRAAGLATTTVQPWASTVRAALILAAEKGAIPVVFPRYHEDDAWEAACHRWLWTGDHETTSRTTRQTYASNLLRLRGILEDMGLVCSPSDLTRELLEQTVYPHILQTLGNPSYRRELAKVLRYVGRVHGEGPYAGSEEVPGQGPEGFLRLADGSADGGDVPVLQEILREAGFHQDLLDFVAWYHDYSTLPESKIWDREDEFPARPPKRHLIPHTWRMRTNAIRAHCYQVLKLSQEEAFPLDLKHTLGVHGVRAARMVELWWRGRAARGEVESPYSQGLQQILLSTGLWARAAHDRARHVAGLRVVTESDRPLSIDDLRRDSADLDDTALLYLDTYQHSRNRSDIFRDRRRKSGVGHVHTDAKDIRRIYKATPPRYWVAIGDHLQARIQGWEGKKGDRFHRLVLNAYIHGLILSTGCRGNELAWLRLHDGSPYLLDDRGDRRVAWEAWMRKNQKAHSARVHERYVPGWLEALYLDEARPFFVQRGIEGGHIKGDHDFLIVQPKSGDSLSNGWYPEPTKGQGIDDAAHGANDRVRKPLKGLRDRWKSAAAGAAAALEQAWPPVRGENALHAVRNSMAYGIAIRLGKRKAADYLGDSEESVGDTYEATDGGNLTGNGADDDALGPLLDQSSETIDLHGRIKELETQLATLTRALSDASGEAA